jgi:hypothetical protein
MTPQPLPFETQPTRRTSLTDKLEAYFKARPGAWVTVEFMADLVGHSGVRQRLLECEKRGLTLERKAWSDEQGRKHLAYRYVPA